MMRTSSFIAPALLAGGLATMGITGTGCGGSAHLGLGTGGSATGTTGTSATQSASTGATTTGSGGSTAGCPTSFATAAMITVGDTMATPCTLAEPGKDANYFSFSGKKGQILLVQTTAKPVESPFDPAYLDTVATLYDAKHQPIARNDDPATGGTNDAQLFTVLPKDGTYYLQIEDCNAAFGAARCGDPAKITNKEYAVQLSTIVADPAKSQDFTFEKEPDDTLAQAVAVGYAADTKHHAYYVSRIAGAFQTAGDVDVYAITIPVDAAAIDTTRERPVGYFTPVPGGKDGDGSTAEIGPVWLVDAADPTHTYAYADLSKGTRAAELSPPLAFGKPHFLFVTRPAGAATGAHDFYFVWHYAGASNPVEKADATPIRNDTLATAETLADGKDPAFPASYFVDGDIFPAGDVDVYRLPVPAGVTKVTASCSAQRSGSGVRGFEMALVDPATGKPFAAITETSSVDAVLEQVAVPPGAAEILLGLRAASQDAMVTSTFYRCGARME